MGKVSALLLVLLLAGCLQTTAGGTFCDIATPVRLSPEAVDAMTDAEVNQVLAHNRKGSEMCGWKR